MNIKIEVGGTFVNKQYPINTITVTKVEGDMVYFKNHNPPFKEYCGKYPEDWIRWRYVPPKAQSNEKT